MNRIRVWSRSLEMPGVMMYYDDRGACHVNFGHVTHWLPREDLEIIFNVWELALQESFRIEHPKGILDVKQVRLVVGEGENKVEVGVADVEKLPNNDQMVEITITNENIAKMLGGNQIKGIIPRIVAEQPELPEEGTNGGS